MRGSRIRFFVFPDMLKNAPMFNAKQGQKGVVGRGKAAVLKAQGDSLSFVFGKGIVVGFLVSNCTNKTLFHQMMGRQTSSRGVCGEGLVMSK